VSVLLRQLLTSVALTVVGATGAFAQNVSNETWLGQVGGTNTIDIEQSGRNNRAGADNAALRLNQDGNDNVLIINQYGYSNQVGAEMSARPVTGVNQVGGRNQIDISQRTGQFAYDGFNVVGAVSQTSRQAVLSGPTNVLEVVQEGPTEAGHRIGSVRQIYLGYDGGSDHNEASINQIGGGPEGSGNRLGDLLQQGTSNSFTLVQGNQANVVGDVRQSGVENVATVEQDLFSGSIGGNLLQYLHQFGFRNVADLVMKGEDNAIQRIFQFNGNLGSVPENRNSIKVTLIGKGNGGTGNGGIGNFVAAAALAVSAAQADIVQIGDRNDVSITVTGQDNRFGAAQYGDGNTAAIAIASLSSETPWDATANESALFQAGLDNWYAHTARGNRNIAGARQFGSYNELIIEQGGNDNVASVLQSGNTNFLEVAQSNTGNTATATITGSNNNGIGIGGRSFSGDAAVALAASNAPTLTPGRLFQDGLNNAVTANVVGSENKFAFYQQGNSNLAGGIIVGASNQLAVVQVGDSNVAMVEQFGSGNTAVILQ